MPGSLAVVVVLFGTGVAGPVAARPTAPSVMCGEYPDVIQCAGRAADCRLCHTSTDPVGWNVYGMAIQAAMPRGVAFEDALPVAMRTVDAEDSDGDGVVNYDELAAGTEPAVADRAPMPMDNAGRTNPLYDVSGYDPVFAFRRVKTIYCGESPTYDEMVELRAMDEAAQRERVHVELTSCLESNYWKESLLPRLADKRIRPLRAAGPDSNIQIAGMRLVIGDYFFDYRLWTHVLSGDRDMRELLTADYHIVLNDAGEPVQTREILEKSDPDAIAGGQMLAPERRAGMITTQWFLALNTMFSAMPRTTAAQAYRAYLGMDISQNEGLMPIAGEPVDVDSKGVAAPRCAICHSTLDPLSYAFINYEGIHVSSDLRFGDYRPERATERVPAFDSSQQISYIFGQRVESLPELAELAANSDEFKRNMAMVFFEQALSRSPEGADQTEFQELWRSLPDDGYSANRLIHRFVDTTAFGAP